MLSWWVQGPSSGTKATLRRSLDSSPLELGCLGTVGRPHFLAAVWNLGQSCL